MTSKLLWKIFVTKGSCSGMQLKNPFSQQWGVDFVLELSNWQSNCHLWILTECIAPLWGERLTHFASKFVYRLKSNHIIKRWILWYIIYDERRWNTILPTSWGLFPSALTGKNTNRWQINGNKNTSYVGAWWFDRRSKSPRYSDIRWRCLIIFTVIRAFSGASCPIIPGETIPIRTA